jgi:hypothetical protein
MDLPYPRVAFNDPDRFRQWEANRLAEDISKVSTESSALREFAALPQAAIVATKLPAYAGALVPKLLDGRAAAIADALERWRAVAILDTLSPDIRVLRNARARLARLRRNSFGESDLDFVVRMVKSRIEHEQRMAEIEASRQESTRICEDIKEQLAERGICVDEGSHQTEPPSREERIAEATDPVTGSIDLAKFKGTMH